MWQIRVVPCVQVLTSRHVLQVWPRWLPDIMTLIVVNSMTVIVMTITLLIVFCIIMIVITMIVLLLFERTPTCELEFYYMERSPQ